MSRTSQSICGDTATRAIRAFVVMVGLGASLSAIAADERVTVLDPFTVKADRIEDFGFDLTAPGHPVTKGGPPTWTIHFVVPNTAAAKAGLKPGDRLLKVDGKPVTFRAWRDWAEIRRQKRASAAAGGSVTWNLEVESAGQKEIRSIDLTLPTPAPRWGASIWQAPEGRAVAVVSDEGPLAGIARLVLNNGVWTKFGWPFLKTRMAPEFVGTNSAPFLAYYWTIFDEAGRPHKIVVSQLRGRTDIILASGTSSSVEYLTSPSGVLDEAVAWPGRKPLTGQKAEAGFQKEVEFWTQRVGKVSPRWPLELLPHNSAAASKQE